MRQGSPPQPQQPLFHLGFPGDLGSSASFGGVSHAPSQGLLELNQTGSGGVVSRSLGSRSSRPRVGFQCPKISGFWLCILRATGYFLQRRVLELPSQLSSPALTAAGHSHQGVVGVWVPKFFQALGFYLADRSAL